MSLLKKNATRKLIGQYLFLMRGPNVLPLPGQNKNGGSNFKLIRRQHVGGGEGEDGGDSMLGGGGGEGGRGGGGTRCKMCLLLPADILQFCNATTGDLQNLQRKGC